jgi:hypothetical protein
LSFSFYVAKLKYFSVWLFISVTFSCQKVTKRQAKNIFHPPHRKLQFLRFPCPQAPFAKILFSSFTPCSAPIFGRANAHRDWLAENFIIAILLEELNPEILISIFYPQQFRLVPFYMDGVY